MTIKTTQTCDKCGRSRQLITGGVSMSPETGGWRELKGKHVCDACINIFMVEPSWKAPI